MQLEAGVELCGEQFKMERGEGDTIGLLDSSTNNSNPTPKQ